MIPFKLRAHGIIKTGRNRCGKGVVRMKRAVVLSGGGAKGAYEVGVWQAMRETDFVPDVITGTSVGALNGALMMQDDFDRAVEIWESITMDKILKLEEPIDFGRLGFKGTIRAFVNEVLLRGGMDPSPLGDLLAQHLDEKKVRAARPEFGIVTVSVAPLGKHTLFLEDIPEGQLNDYLLASAACYPLFRPYKMDGMEFIDGGYYDNLPLSMAAERGATEILAVDLRAIGVKSSMSVKNRKNINIKFIVPTAQTGSMVDFTAENAKSNIRLGYLDACREFGFYEGNIYTFRKGEAAENLSALRGALAALLHRTGLGSLRMKKEGEPEFALPFLPGRSRRIDSAALLSLAETAGDMFGLPRLSIYTFSEFNNALLEVYFAEKGALPKEEQKAYALLQALREAPREGMRPLERRLCCALTGLFDGEETIAGAFSAAAATGVFSASFYLRALLETRGLTAREGQN